MQLVPQRRGLRELLRGFFFGHCVRDQQEPRRSLARRTPTPPPAHCINYLAAVGNGRHAGENSETPSAVDGSGATLGFGSSSFGALLVLPSRLALVAPLPLACRVAAFGIDAGGRLLVRFAEIPRFFPCHLAQPCLLRYVHRRNVANDEITVFLTMTPPETADGGKSNGRSAG